MSFNLSHLFPAICFGLCSAAALAQQDVRSIRDVNYVEAANPSNTKEADRRQLDLYIPVKSKCFPTLLSVHGGGLRKGDKSEDEKKVNYLHLLGLLWLQLITAFRRRFLIQPMWKT